MSGVKLCPADKVLKDASQNVINLLGKVTLPIRIRGDSGRVVEKDVEFYVSDSNSTDSILLGRNFMQLFGSVTFDFDRNRIKLGDIFCSGFRTRCGRAKISKMVVVPAKSEVFIDMKSRKGNGLVKADFTPDLNNGISGLYAAKSRVVPNTEGHFRISVVNVTSQDIVLRKDGRLGKLTECAETVAEVDFEDYEGQSIDWTKVNIGDIPDADRTRVLQLLEKYKDVFAKNTKKPKQVNNASHSIDTGGCLPIFKKPYQIPYAYTENFNTQTEEMLKNGIIRPSKSPWNAPVILVKKKDQSLRFVCDFRALNDATIKDTYPLPKIGEVIDRMEGSTYFTTLDCASAYWSIPLKEEDKEKTAFSGPRGKYEFNVTPYGLCNAGASYQRMMDISLSGLSMFKILTYLDDIVIFSRSLEEHEKQLEMLLERLRRCNISLNLSKCSFAMKEVDFLGYSLNGDGVKPQKRLTDAIRNFPTPNTKKELKRFLGISNYYRDFIPMYADISSPLNALTSEKSDYLWTNECENAFVDLKSKLCSYPVLTFPRLGESFVVEVDGSDVAVGGVLLQEDERGIEHPVAYFSNTLKREQRNWSAHSKEAYAIVLATRHWKSYLVGTKFRTRSDHNPLTTLRKTKDPRGKFQRWLTELEELTFDIEYKPGKLNVVPDALSRVINPAEHEPVDDLDDKLYNILIEGENFMSQLKEEQMKDEVIADAKLKTETSRKIDRGRYRHVQKQLRVENDLLTKSGRIIVPPSLRSYVTENFHGDGHFGTEKLYEKISRKFYWPNLYRYVQNHTTHCEICQKCKPSIKAPKAPLVPIQDPEYPMQFITLDIAYMVKDIGNYRYLLLIGDLFSKYIAGVPLRDQTAEDICNALQQEWLLVHGIPNFLLTDQGSNVDGTTMREVCKKFGIEKRRTSAYHSQGNGFAERSIRNVKETFRTYLLDNKMNQNKWRCALKDIIFALNTSVSAATKQVPYSLVHGRDVVVPADLRLGCSKDQLGRDIASAEDYAAETKIRLEKAYETVNKTLSTYRARMETNYNKSIKHRQYSVGDEVWLRKRNFKQGESEKLAPRRTGPWTIIEAKDNGRNFRIRNNRNGKISIIHHDRIEPVKREDLTNRDNDCPRTPDRETQDDLSDNENENETYSSSSDDENDYDEIEDDNHVQNPQSRYPTRHRTQRQIPGTIPWDAVPDLDGGE